MEFRSYREFWPFYVLQHSKLATRLWHAVGTSFVFLLLILTGFTGKWWLLLLIPVIAYGLAWFSHFFIEGNKPATFGHPVWSLRGDFHMYFLTISGQMGAEVERVKKLYAEKK